MMSVKDHAWYIWGTDVDGWDRVAVWGGRMKSVRCFSMDLLSARHTVTGVLWEGRVSECLNWNRGRRRTEQLHHIIAIKDTSPVLWSAVHASAMRRQGHVAYLRERTSEAWTMVAVGGIGGGRVV